MGIWHALRWKQSLSAPMTTVCLSHCPTTMSSGGSVLTTALWTSCSDGARAILEHSPQTDPLPCRSNKTSLAVSLVLRNARPLWDGLSGGCSEYSGLSPPPPPSAPPRKRSIALLPCFQTVKFSVVCLLKNFHLGGYHQGSNGSFPVGFIACSRESLWSASTRVKKE